MVCVGLVAALLAGCAKTSSNNAATDDFGVGDCNPSDCFVVDMAASPEKIEFIADQAKQFNATRAKVGDKRVVIQPASKSSGGAAQLLADGWDESVEGPKPVVWSPAASSWGAVLDQRLTVKGQPAMAGQGESIMATPLTIAMPEPMAQALGYPGKAIGWSDILALAKDPQGWSTFGHPEWGPFRLGKTNPNFSTSGLNALIAQNYAATGKTRDLTEEDLNKAEVTAFNKGVESSVVHYGDTTLTFLNNWYRADQRGNPFSYASAVAVEEKSVLDYNSGNPDGVLDQGEEPRPPRIKLVAIYPKEGTLFSDNPFFVLKAPWVDDQEQQGARQFLQFMQKPENQQKALQYNFRPGNPQVPLASPIVKANGVDPDQPQTLEQVPEPAVLVTMLDQWQQNRKSARVLLVIDVSGSMGDTVDGSGGRTKLDLAKQAATDSLGQFKDDDQVGLWVFSTSLGPSQNETHLELIPVAPAGQTREQIRARINALVPEAGTPLYQVTADSFATMTAGYDPSRINAVVLLTDGKNEDGSTSDDSRQLADLVKTLQSQTQGENAKPIRLFTIGYGKDADINILKQMAEAGGGASYKSTNPKDINKVFTQVVSNF